MFKVKLSLFCLLACFSIAQAENDPQAALKARLARLEALRAERPNDGLLAYYEAMSRANLGERDRALGLLRGLLGRKLGLVPAPDLGFDALWSDAEFQTLRQQLSDDEIKTAEASAAFTLRDPKLIPEGIAFHARSKRFFLSSVAQHKIVQVDARGRQRDFSQPADQLDAVLGLAVDQKNGFLYAVSTNGFEESGKLKRRNAVLRYRVLDGKLLQRYEIEEARQLNDLALATDGSVYCTDSAAGSLYRLKSGESAFSRIGEIGSLRGANGVAVADQGTVYVTLSTGIARLDPKGGEAARMPQPDTVVTGGIDGLYWHKGALYGVQNSTNPGRVIRVQLSADGQKIEGLSTLQSHHHPLLNEPTTGVIAGEAMYVIANSFVGRYQPDGSLKDATSLKPTVVLKLPLSK